jgi:hypothetical protein
VPRGAQLPALGALAALCFGIPAAVLAAVTPVGDKPSPVWLAALVLWVLGIGAACGAMVRPEEPARQALAVAAALAVGFDAGVSLAFATGRSCAALNGAACGALSWAGALLLVLPAFGGFLVAVVVGRTLVRRGER